MFPITWHKKKCPDSRGHFMPVLQFPCYSVDAFSVDVIISQGSSVASENNEANTP